MDVEVRSEIASNTIVYYFMTYLDGYLMLRHVVRKRVELLQSKSRIGSIMIVR